MQIKSNTSARIKALIPGIFLALLGIVAIIGGRRFQIGTLTSMGSGFMPALCGALLLLIAFFLLLAEWRNASEASRPLPLRALACAAGSILLWALLAERAGFVITSMLQLLLAFAAMPQHNWFKVLGLGFIITAICYVLFVLLLGIPIPAFRFQGI